MPYVITDPELGVYLGRMLGMSFWTKVDTCGLGKAVTFPTIDAAQAEVKSWLTHNDPAIYTFAECPAGDDGYATIPMLKAAGLTKLLAEMEISAAGFERKQKGIF